MSIALARPPKEYDVRDQSEFRNSLERVLRFLFESTNTLQSRGMTAALTTAVTNDAVDLTVDVTASKVDYPITVDVFEGAPSGSAIVSTSITGNSTLTKLDFAALGARALPLRELQKWYVRLTNTAGVEQWYGPTSVDRDALPSGTVTPLDDALKCEYDNDTDSISITLANGATKVFSGLSGPGTATYTVGDAVTTGSVESALAPDEDRSTYVVTYMGGGASLVMYRGSLHGANKDYTEPSMEVLVTPGTDHVTFAYTAAAGSTAQMRTNGGSWATAAASPFDVARPDAGDPDTSIQMRAVRDADAFEGAPRTFIVTAVPPDIAGFVVVSVGADVTQHPGDGGGQMTVTWSTAGIPADATFDVAISVLGGTTGAHNYTYFNQTSGADLTANMADDSYGTVTVTAYSSGGAPIQSGFTNFAAF